MTKGIRKDKSLGEEVVDLDRMLVLSVRRNMAVAMKLRDGTGDEGLKDRLSKFLGRHALSPREVAPQKEIKAPPKSEREKSLAKLSRYLQTLSDWDLGNIIELARSMCKGKGKGKGGDTVKPRRNSGKENGKSEAEASVAAEGVKPSA